MPLDSVAASLAEVTVELPRDSVRQLISELREAGRPWPTALSTYRAITILIGIHYNLLDRTLADLLSGPRHDLLIELTTKKADALLATILPPSVHTLEDFKPYIGSGADVLLHVMSDEVAQMDAREQMRFALELAVHDWRGIFEMYHTTSHGPSVAGLLNYEGGKALAEALGSGFEPSVMMRASITVAASFTAIRQVTRKTVQRARRPAPAA